MSIFFNTIAAPHIIPTTRLHCRFQLQADCAAGMISALKDTRWSVTQIYPRDDLAWIRDAWLEQIRAYIRNGWLTA